MSDDTPPKGVQFGTQLPNTGVTILEYQLEICSAQRESNTTTFGHNKINSVSLAYSSSAENKPPRHAQHYLGLALLIVQALPYTCRVVAQRWVVADPWMRRV